ncbi:MAG: tetratricopeptide repeat protein [Elusimicrobia bacterium]|nr:tetratricopeptide repeat protein [Elusimicrobiota bacterium]
MPPPDGSPANFLALLDGPDPAVAVEAFLDGFERVFPDMRSAALADFAAGVDHQELPRLLVPLLYNHHALASRAILDLLVRSPHAASRAGLEDLQASLPQCHPLQGALSATLETLRVRGRSGLLKPSPASRDVRHRCYLVAPDGAGSSCAILSKLRPDGRVAFLDFVANERLGVKQAFGGAVPPAEFDKMVRDMDRSEGWVLAEVSAARVLVLARRAERRPFEAGRPLPAAYLAWKWEASLAREPGETKLARREAAFAALASRAPRTPPEFPDVFSLFASPCLEVWGFDGEAEKAAGALAERCRREDPSRLRADPESLLSPELIGQGLPEADLPLWRERLVDFAFALWMRSEEREARLALWTAETLTAADRLTHPFSRALAVRSLGVAPRLRAKPDAKGEGPARGMPCPCGSRRKFKKCCGRTGAAVVATEEGIERKLRDGLAGFALSLPSAELERAWAGFEPGPETLDSARRGDPQRMSIFLDWLLLGCEIGGKNGLERFEAARGFLLDDAQAACLARIKACRFGVFEVQEVRPGEGVTLCEVFSGEALEARDLSASRQLARWDVLAAWILPEAAPAGPAASGAGAAGARARSPLWGVALPFEAAAKAELKTTLEDAFEKLKALQPMAEWRRFLNGSVPILRRLQRTLIERREQALANPVTPEGDPVRFCEASYSLPDFRAALGALRACGELEEGSARIGPDDRLEEIAFDWLVPLQSLEKSRPPGTVVLYAQRVGPDGEPDDHVGYAHLKLSRQGLTVETLSRPRLDAARKLLEGRCRGLSLLSQSERSMREARDASGGQAADPAQYPESADQTPATAVALQRLTRRWLTTPVPMLEGRSPVDAARDPEGRSRLQELLKDYENRGLRGGRPPQLFAVAQMLALRELLGLPVPDYLRPAERLYRDRLERAAAPREEDDPDERDYKAAMRLFADGKHREAARACERLKDRFRAHPMNFRLWSNLAVCYCALKEPERAIPLFETALDIYPGYELALNNLEVARAMLKVPPELRRAPPTRIRAQD